jgi:hypothetical protein
MQQFKFINHAGYDIAVNQDSDRKSGPIERSHKMLAGYNEGQRLSGRPRNRWRNDVTIQTSVSGYESDVTRGVFKPHPSPKFRSFEKAKPNFQLRGKYVPNNLIRNGFHSFAN